MPGGHRDRRVNWLAGQHAQHQQLKQRHRLVAYADIRFGGIRRPSDIKQALNHVLGLAHGLRRTRSSGSQTSKLLARKTPRMVDAAGHPVRELPFCLDAVGIDTDPPADFTPAITIGLTWARRRSFSVSSGGTRTIRPPCPLTATDMLPLIRNARPPNIRFSSTPRSRPNSSRIGSARSVS